MAFTSASVDSNSHVRGLDAPSVLADTSPEGVPDTLQAILDEMERVVRDGFGSNEIARLVTQRRTAAESAYDARATVQDVDYAESYVANFLAGSPIPDATTELDLMTDILDAVTPDVVADRFRARWTATAPHVLVVGPADEPLPTSADLLATIAALADRELEPRDDEGTAATELMARPEPITETAVESLTEAPWAFLEPTRLVFPNGATVIYNVTDITDGDVAFAGRSLGGSSIVADEDVVDAMLAGEVVASSGVGELGQVELDRFLADADVDVAGAIGPYTEGFSGRAAAPDLEVLFQLVNLYMTAATGRPGRASTTWRGRTGRSSRIPASDPGLAGIVALYEERYGDEPRLQYLPSPEDFATLDAAGVERVWRDRFGDASDWVFAFSGDFDEDVLVDLARRYVGTLPATGRSESWVDVESPPPAGIVERTVEAGTGAQGALNVLYTVPVESIDPSDVAAAAVVTQLLSTLLTDDIREALGESYSPFATVAIYGDPDPVVETYVSVTGAPDRIGAIAQFVQDDVGALRADGPSQDEFDTAVAQVSRDIELFSDAQLIDEILEAEVNGVVDLEDFADQDVGAGGAHDRRRAHVRRRLSARRSVHRDHRGAALTRREETHGDLAGIGVPVGRHIRWQRHELRALQRGRGARGAVPLRREPSRDAHRDAGRRRLRLALLPAPGAARPAVRLSGPRSRTSPPRASGRTRTSCCSTRTRRRRSARSTGILRCSRTSSAIRTRSTTTTPPRT